MRSNLNITEIKTIHFRSISKSAIKDKYSFVVCFHDRKKIQHTHIEHFIRIPRRKKEKIFEIKAKKTENLSNWFASLISISLFEKHASH